MIDTPIFAATMLDLGFDPESVPPNQSRTDRKIASERWLAEATKRVAAADLTPAKRTRKKAS